MTVEQYLLEFWYEDLALGIEWAFRDEISRLDLEAVEGDDANN